MRFRYLRADEVDARVNICKEDGVSLLLYKDARCDMNILDETVGALNWQRHHTRDNRNCIVAIWDEKKHQWIEKEDTGTESYSEAEKGLASDSFKRACFNFGIGRELYTAPFIWISQDKCTIKPKLGNKGFSCYDHFKVTSMYVENGKITQLTIINEKRGQTVFEWGETPQHLMENATDQQMVLPMPNDYSKDDFIDVGKWNALTAVAGKKGVDYRTILSNYGVATGSEMRVSEWMEAMRNLTQMKDIGGEHA